MRVAPERRGSTSESQPRNGAQRARRALAEEPPFDIVEAKLRAPVLRPGTISRTALVNRLRAARAFPVVTVVAAAGYGKSTVLAQWAERDSRPVAWVSLDEGDNDPVVFLRHVATALDRVEPLDAGVLDALRSPARAISSALPRLAATFSSRERPIVLVLDDLHALHSRESLGAVSSLAAHVSPRSMIVLASRVKPTLPIAKWRAEGKLYEVGVDELALSPREATMLLSAARVKLADDEATELIRRCEGWPAALYLAALALRDGNRDLIDSGGFSGEDSYLADYLYAEYLSVLRPGHLRFLRRTAVLDRMCGSLCDAVLDDKGSGRELEMIERWNLFLTPLDRRREWYRYHHLFQELLLHDLAANEPELIPILHRRAADWFEARGDPESALKHACASGDRTRAAAIITRIALPVYNNGRVVTVERWLRQFERTTELERFPEVAVLGSRIHAMRGRSAEAERWLEAAERGMKSEPLASGASTVRAWIAVLRAVMCRDGVDQMRLDAESALSELERNSEWRTSALLMQGSAYSLLGDDERADEILAEAVDDAERLGANDAQVVALSERSLIAAARGDHAEADAFALEARVIVTAEQLEGYPSSAIEDAASARALLRHGHWHEARTHLNAARGIAWRLTESVPWLSVRTRLELARACITLRDTDGARALLDEATAIQGARPELGVLRQETHDLRKEVDAIPELARGTVTGLTPAELRLLPLLSTHLTFREIAEKLHVSRNTIKTQAISVYRKLGVSSRSDAIAEAIRLGLRETVPGAWTT